MSEQTLIIEKPAKTWHKMDPETKELIKWVRNFLDFEGEHAIGPDCPDPDGHHHLTCELIEMMNDMEKKDRLSEDRLSEDSEKAQSLLEKAMERGVTP